MIEDGWIGQSEYDKAVKKDLMKKTLKDIYVI